MCTSKPKIPAPTPVIERQAYRNPSPRESVAGGPDAAARRRRVAGMATSSQGDTSQASTTRRVKMGGDDPLTATLGGGGASVTTPAPSPDPAGPVSAPQTTPAANRTQNYAGMSPGAIAVLNGPLAARALLASRNRTRGAAPPRTAAA